MKPTLICLIATALLASTGARAQTIAFDFRAVVQPGTVIGGHTFTQATTLGNVALNDAGEIAFVASEPGQPPAVFTSRRIVARAGDVIGGKAIVLLPLSAILAINNAGQVAFVASYADPKAASGRGIFVDDHLVLIAPPNADLSALTLTDDGRIVAQNPGAAPAPKSTASPSAIPDILRSIPVKPPKGFPISLPPIPNKPNRREPNNQRQVACERPPLPLFPVNHRGQVLIPVNFGKGGFLLLLGTPVGSAQASAEPDSLENDPQFQHLSPAAQELVRKIMGNIGQAVDETRQQPAQPAPAAKP
jgi:hypothetical protein